MPRSDQIEAFSAQLDDLHAVQVARLIQLWSPLIGRSNDYIRDALLVEYPELVDTFAGAATDLAAQWYDDLDPQAQFQARPAPLPPLEKSQATVRWAVEGLFTQAAVASPVARLGGSSQRALYDGARNTLSSNAAREGVAWARHASANACEFCRMLATRGDVYASESVALRQSSGDRYHDNCRCMAVPVRGRDSYSPPPYVEEWQAQYTQARDAADGVDAKSILAAWRQL